jgi:type III pantothenate kinase
MSWLHQQGHAVLFLDDPKQLPLAVVLERPDHVGIDRLLDAVAANSRRPPGQPAVVVDAGSAVTVDWLDDRGTFCGGAILPGFRLMSRALHDYTALLPLVEIKTAGPAVPGVSTRSAVEAGIFWALVGGVNAIIARLTAHGAKAPTVFLTGGDAALLADCLDTKAILWQEMTLEGIRLAARTQE